MTKKIFNKAAALLLALVLTFGLHGDIFAVLSDDDQQSISDLEQQIKETQEKIDAANEQIEVLRGNIEEKEKFCEELALQIDNYQAQIDLLNESIADLELQISTIDGEINTLNTEIDGLNTAIDNNNTEIKNTEKEIEDLYTELKERLYDLYVNGTMSDLEMLFDFDNSNDFSTYLIMLELNDQRAERDEYIIGTLNTDIAKLENLNVENQNMIDDIEAKKLLREDKKSELEVNKQKLVDSNAVLISAQDELKATQDEAFSYITQLEYESAAYQMLIDDLNEDIAKFDQMIDEIVASASKGDGNIQSIPGGFIWPLQYSDVYISSHYGYRTDPISGVRKLHGGTDTCCWSGTMNKAVSASAPGTVIISEYHSAYGNYVGIDHGNGIVTIYAHNSSRVVSVGDYVEQGDIIAYAGTTGYSTGAHCHFEVRVNGNKVNPLDYASLPN